jgi:glycosyltransferase involved in cell wall biosynthesis
VSTGELVLAIWGGAFSALWCFFGLAGLRSALVFRTLRQLPAPEPPAWPRLTVVVAACDEEATIGPALMTLVAQDYPDLEIVVVDDRSKDATGRIVDEVAAREPRVRAVHVRTLPAGWLGKVHAMHRATEIASGAFILYTDADVHFAPGTLRHAVAHAIHARLDHLAVAPEIEPIDLAHDAVGAAFASSFLFGTRAVDVSRPGSSAFVGVGAFNLVRREALAATPGWEWLRLEILDDVGLGYMMKRSGGRSAFAVGLSDVRVAWYESLPAMARGLEKNMFGAFCRYRVSRLVALAVFAAVLFPAPIVALVAAPRPWLPLLGATAILLFAAGAGVVALRTRRSVLPFLLGGWGAFVLGLFVLRSAWRVLRDGGVTWRGTFYPLEALRKGQRVKL